jgi:nitrogen fixation negative regulator NifL
MNKKTSIVLTKKWYVLAFIFLLTLMISSGAYVYFSYEADNIRKEAHEELKAITSLKVSQITNWNNERLADAKSISQNPFLMDCLNNLVSLNYNASLKHEITKYLELFNVDSSYSDIILSDSKGKLLFSLDPKLQGIDSTTTGFIKNAVTEKQIIFTDLYQSPLYQGIHLDYISPIINKKNIVTAVLILRINPYLYLYPLMKKWLVQSRTPETLIVSKGNGNVFYLNDLNHHSNTAMKIKMQLNRKEVPAVQGALGYKGIFEGISYRGTKVLSYISPVSGTPWIMITQIDNSEIYTGLYLKEIAAISFTVLLILVLGGGLVWFYHYRQRNIYRELFVKGKELHEYHEEFRTILYSIGDGVITVDINGKIKQMNPTAEILTGWNEPEAKSRQIEEVFNIIDESTRNKIDNPVHNVLSKGTIEGFTNHTILISRNGDEIPIADSGAPIRNEHGEIEGIVLVFRDKTEEHKANQLIRQNEARLKRAEIVSKSGNWELHLNSHIMLSSEGAEKIYGVTKSPLDYKTVKNNPLPEYRPLLDNALKNLVENNIPYDIEFRIKATDTGEIKDIHSIAEFDKEKKIIFGAIQDITARKQTENILRDSEERFRRTFELAAIGNAVISTDGRFINVNDAFCKMTGYSKEELVHSNYITIIYNDDVDISKESLRKLLSGETESNSFEERYVKKDGSIIWINTNTTLLKDIKGNPINFIAHFIDITDRKLTEESLSASEVRYRRLFETAKDGILILDAYSGLIIDTNQFMAELIGSTSGNILGKKLWELNSFKKIATNLEQFQRLNQTEYTRLDNLLLENEKGKQVYVEFVSNVYNVKHKKVIQCNIRDITERKRTEELLQQSENKYRNLFNNVQVGMFRTRVGGDAILDFNEYYLKIFGYTREEMENTSSTIYWADPLEREEMIRRLKSENIVNDFECSFFNKDGNIIYCLTSVRSYPEEGILEGSIIDITERRRMEQEVEKNWKILQLFVEHAPASIAMFDTKMNYIAVSHRFLDDYDIGNQDVIGKSHYEIFPEISERWKEIHRRCLLGARDFCEEDPFMRANGELDWIRWEIMPWFEQQGKIGGILLFSEVVTERKLAEEALRQSELRYRQLVDNAPLPVIVSSITSSNFLYINKSAYELMDFDAERKNIHDYTLTDFYANREQRDEILDKLKKEGRISGYEIELKTLEGKRIIALFSSVETAFENEPAIFTSFYNITDRKIAEGLLAVSEVRYRRLFESAKDGILILDFETGIIVDVNPFLAELLGYSHENFIGKEIWEIGYFKDILSDKGKFLELQKEEYIRYDDLPLETAQGKQINVEFVSNVYTVSHNKVIQCNVRDITERKMMEAEIRESEERFRMIFENVFDGISIYTEDPDPTKRKLISCNERYAAMAGRSREELLRIGNTQGIHILREDDSSLKHLESLEKGTAYQGSFSWIRPDGKENVIEYVAKPIMWQGKVYSIGIDRDITERSKLLENQQRLSTAVNQSQITIVITDKKGNIEYVNPSFTEITGYTYEEVVNQNARILKSGAQHKEFYQDLWKTILSGKNWNGVMQNRKKNGKLFWEFAKISPVKNESGEITSFVAVKEDITDKVEKDEELKKYREHLEELVEQKTEQLSRQNIFFRTLIDTIPNPIYVKDNEFRFTEVNKAYEEFVGITRDNILGKTISDIVPVEFANYSNQFDNQLLVYRDSVTYESFAQINEKGRIPIMVYKSSFGLPGKKPEGITALIIDISKQKEMEKTNSEALKKEKELNEMKTNFISIASHEFRTPLTAILSSADLLEMHHKKWEEAKTIAHLKKIQDSVEYIISMLDEVLTISKSDRGKIEFNPSIINLNEFTGGIIEQVKLQASPAHNIIYDYRLPYQNVNADSKLLTHILNNLLTNAVKFSPKGGNIALSVEDENEFIKFTVKDSGIGIPEEDINKLYEPFFRAGNSANIKGTGLGLSIVKKYVEIHNGEISLKSEQGKGTEFYVKIKKENKNI